MKTCCPQSIATGSSLSRPRITSSWDMRSKMHVLEHAGSRGELFTIDLHPTQDELFLTGGDDKDVVLWDKRKPNERLKTFTNHEDTVTRVEWCPYNNVLFSSSGADRKVCIWDKSKVGKEQTAEEKIDGPPELLVRLMSHPVYPCRTQEQGG